LSFLCSLQYKEFHIKILHVCRLRHLLYLDLFSDFFETNMDDFRKKLNSRSTGAHEPKTLFGEPCGFVGVLVLLGSG
jgi:hypothetical protein